MMEYSRCQRWILALVILGLFTAIGCKDREPVPIHDIVVRGPGNGFIFDGLPMMGDQLRAELASIAEAKRTGTGGSVRAYLRIRAEPGVDYDRVYELISTCNSLGLDKIETAGK